MSARSSILRRHAISLLAFLTASIGATGLAEAQEQRGFLLDRFSPSERGSTWFSQDSLDFRGKLRPAAGIVGDYAHDALVIQGSDGRQIAAPVSHQAILHAGTSLVISDRVRLGLTLPLLVSQSGDAGTASSTTVGSPSSAPVGDLRATFDLRAFGKHGDVVTAAAGVETYAPTGSTSSYTSDGTFRAIPRFLVAGTVGPFVYAGRAGVHFRPANRFAGSDGGTELVVGGAAGVRLGDKVVVGPELFASTVLNSDQGAFRTRNTPLEAMLGAHVDVLENFRVGAAVGAGIAAGYGSPQMRGLLAIEWAPRPAPERVPPEPTKEDRSEPAPPPPPPVVAMAPAPVPVVGPADSDADGIPDTEDACPNEKGPTDPDPTKNGCPHASIAGNVIRIRDAIKFRFASAELDPAGDAVLEAVRSVLLANRDIQRIRIEGHTDSVGSANLNSKLSEARAKAVRTWLVAHDVPAERLESQGFGQSRPLTTNDTEEGRRENRRVEFHIVSKGASL